MRPGLAEGTARNRPKALVLGTRGVAHLIAKQLEAEGFEPVLQEETGLPLPLPSDPNALSDCREVLARFVRNAGAVISPYAHCVHPGVSAWAERPELAMIAQEFGLNVVCPPARVVSLFSNKLSLLGEAEQLGIPNLVLSFDPITSAREVEGLMRGSKRFFPLVLKSVRGGGRFGLCVVHHLDELEKKFPLWQEQLRRNYGEAILFAERYLEGARHIVLPFVRFHDGRTDLFPMVDVSLQVRYRKVVEVCPATGVDGAVKRQMKEWAQKLLDHCGYVGVGVLEFLVDSSRAFFLEGSARLNSGFHLWEKVDGTQAVAWQLAALRGMPEQAPVRAQEREWSTGISLRLYAEDSLLQLPQPGFVHELSERREWRFPGAAAELTLAIEKGTEVPPSGDGLLGQLWVGAQDRKQALTVARGVLDELWIAGSLQSNERFLSELILHPWVREGMFHAGFVDEEFIPEIRPSAEFLKVFASLCESISGSGVQGAASEFRWAVGDQWVKPDPSSIRWVASPQAWLREGARGVSGFLELSEGRSVRACAFPVGPGRWQVRVGDWVMSVRQVRTAATKRTQNGKKTFRLFSLVTGRVHSILYRENSTVPAHEPVLIVESLRVLVPHALPNSVKILNWQVTAEEMVKAGQELAEFELEQD